MLDTAAENQPTPSHLRQAASAKHWKVDKTYYTIARQLEANDMEEAKSFAPQIKRYF